jgi:hypothetical protein
MGVAVGDYDNDGYEDLYVTAHGGKPALPQQWARHVHRCYGPSGRRRWWMVNQRGLD